MAVQDIYDCLCIGFGPAGLAIAIAAYEQQNLSFLAIEQQADFQWHPGMLIPGAKMQISFVKDLATMRDPKSEYTFLNYLFEHDRLLKFLNLDTFLPAREEYQDYMHWAAQRIQAKYNCVRYKTFAKSFEPTSDPGVLKVVASSPKGEVTYHARNVIVCTGGQPSIPKAFPEHRRLHHSSEFMKVLPQIRKEGLRHGVCVIGSGQSAAEIWSHLTHEFPASYIDLKFRSSALKPSDDSPFVNQIFDPNTRIDEWYRMSPQARKALIAESRATNYSVVRLHLLEEMYEHLYTQELPGHEKKHHISPNTIIDSWHTDDLITIEFHDSTTGQASRQTFDHVFCATGYERNFHTKILSQFPDVVFPTDSDNKQPLVDRNYRVVRDDGENKAGIYLQGLCESSHGLSDTLLSVLATRGAEVINDIVSRSRASSSSDSEGSLSRRSMSLEAWGKRAAREKERISEDSTYSSQRDSRSSSPPA